MWYFIILLIVVVALIAYLISAYNGLIRRRNQIENAWSQIDVQLKRRLDLIPNLVETVKGYAAHEKDTLDAVIRARNALGDCRSSLCSRSVTSAVWVTITGSSSTSPSLTSNLRQVTSTERRPNSDPLVVNTIKGASRMPWT